MCPFIARPSSTEVLYEKHVWKSGLQAGATSYIFQMRPLRIYIYHLHSCSFVVHTENV
jgi:hypothetical protein